MSGYSLFTSCSFDEKNNVIDYYRGKDCLKKFCQDLKKQAKSIVNFEKKEMIELTEEEVYKHHVGKRCFICKGKFNEDNDDDDDDDDDNNNNNNSSNNNYYYYK